MIDPLLSLAMSIHANPGVYAFLLGSGVSRSAGIPTGWEIVLDLVRKLAALRGEDCEPDPAAWFHEAYGHDPDYSELLDHVGKSAAERQQLLRSYFEPDEAEREQGLKQATAAHRGIARLVARGFCRVILTTNFDKLIERAIEGEGIAPTVISTSDAVEGALPLVHQKCCVVKLHGDYLDTRIRNTPQELHKYDKTTRQLLDRILDEFGIVTCGWSAQWDGGLRAAIERCASRRFSFYFATQTEPGEEAKRLLNLRSGHVIQIDDADSFLTKLADLVTALDDSKRAHPTSVQACISLVKRYVADPCHAIKLDDFVMAETELAYERLADYNNQILRRSKPRPSLGLWFQHYREIIERLLTVVIHGCACGSSEHTRIWIEAIQRIARPPQLVSGSLSLSDEIRQYPAVVLLYGTGLAAFARGQIHSLAEILTKPNVRDHRGTRPLLVGVKWSDMSERFKAIDEYKGHYTPLSEDLFSNLREPLRRYIPDDSGYEHCFDSFEYIRSLVYADLDTRHSDHPTQLWAPLGCFAWRHRRESEASALATIAEEIDTLGEDWPLLRCGLFKGSLSRLREIKDKFDQLLVAGLNWW